MPRLYGSVTNDTITGYAGNDRIYGDYGDDTLNGSAGDDRLYGGRGADQLNGGDGDDIIYSRSDAGEMAIAQDVNAGNDPNNEVDAATRMIYPNQAGLSADDTLTGGAGADTFRIETLISAKAEILQKHADPNTGIIDYSMMGVAGENNLVHDHWVDSIGNDVITDFNAGEGDKLIIKGHTTEVHQIDIVDADGDGAVDDTVLHLRSNQGANGGAHNLDLLGTVTVLNNTLTADDFTVDAGVNYGIVENISQLNEAINPLNLAALANNTTDDSTGADTGDDVVDDTSGDDTATGDAGDDSGSDASAGGGATGSADDDGTADQGSGDAGASAGGGMGDGMGDGSGSGADAGSGTGTGTGTGTDGGATAVSQLDALLTPPADAVAGQAPTAGDDVVIYGDGDDNGNGGLGDDLVVGLAGDDELKGGWGDDRISSGDGDDHVHGGHGDDLIAGDGGDDFITGDFGDDIVLGGAGGDELKGNRGEDVLFGGTGDDILSGGAGNDVLMGGAGDDSINGGSGTDALLLTGTLADYAVDMVDGTVQFTNADGETDIVSRVEEFRFLGNGETYVLQDGALALTADTEDLDDLLQDHFLQELIASETGDNAGTAPAAADVADASAGAASADADMTMDAGLMAA